MNLANGLSILFYLLKELSFSFIDFCYSILHFFLFIYLCSDFYDFFPSTNFEGFVVLALFLVALGVKY